LGCFFESVLTKDGKPQARNVKVLGGDGANMLGSVKNYNPMKGYGFISSSMWEGDCYFKGKDLPPQLAASDVRGMKVRFTAVAMQDGKMQARDVIVLQSAAPAGPPPMQMSMPPMPTQRMAQPQVVAPAPQAQVPRAPPAPTMAAPPAAMGHTIPEGTSMVGSVKTFDPAKGYGFISAPNFPVDIYFKPELEPVAVGQQVTFTIHWTPQGKPQAREVTSPMQAGEFLSGTVRRYNPNKGFGFLAVEGRSQDAVEFACLGSTRATGQQVPDAEYADSASGMLVTCLSGAHIALAISEAGKRGDWHQARRLYSAYTGAEIQVFSAAMQAAIRCDQYKQGALIYRKLRGLNIKIDSLAFASALKIHSMLGQRDAVREIWTEAMRECELDALLAAARISAAAAEGDVQTAATVLDQMNNSCVSINVGHLSAAIRACWQAEGSHHNAAKYLFSLHKELDLQPNVITFACLVGAYMSAPLEDILVAYADMKELGILPDTVFAEIFLVTVLRKPKEDAWKAEELRIQLQNCSPERIAAARQAIADFKDVYFQKQNLPMEYQESTAMDGAQFQFSVVMSPAQKPQAQDMELIAMPGPNGAMPGKGGFAGVKRPAPTQVPARPSGLSVPSAMPVMANPMVKRPRPMPTTAAPEPSFGAYGFQNSVQQLMAAAGLQPTLGVAAPSYADGKTRGTVKSFNPMKGFGFIAAPSLPTDVYFNAKSLDDAYRSLQLDGQQVAFNVRYTQDGKIQATDVQ
ncbi:PPR4, partial [Symbiodinium sp. CCMP2456]